MGSMAVEKHIEVPLRDEDKLARWIPIVVPAFAVMLVFLIYMILAAVG